MFGSSYVNFEICVRHLVTVVCPGDGNISECGGG